MCVCVVVMYVMHGFLIDEVYRKMEMKHNFALFFSDNQLTSLEENLSEVLSSCEYVDRAIENATSTQLLLVRKQVGDGLKTIQQIESRTPADTDYIELSLAGLEDAKTVINQIGNIVSSSCIPSQCLAGGDGLRQEQS